MSCTHSDSLAQELKALAGTALDRLLPLLDGEGTPSSCTNCPVCALLAVLRGERPELAVALAERAASVLTALRALLDELPEDPPQPGGSTRRVQHIPVARA